MDEAPSPRLHGRLLQFVSHLFASPAGRPICRVVGAQVIEKKLSNVDFAAEGEPSPIYSPRSFRPGADEGSGE